MKNIILIAITFSLVGCAGTQTREAFTVRTPAYHYEGKLAPNQSALHQEQLNHSLDAAIQKQESLDWRDLQYPSLELDRDNPYDIPMEMKE